MSSLKIKYKIELVIIGYTMSEPCGKEMLYEK